MSRRNPTGTWAVNLTEAEARELLDTFAADRPELQRQLRMALAVFKARREEAEAQDAALRSIVGEA